MIIIGIPIVFFGVICSIVNSKEDHSQFLRDVDEFFKGREPLTDDEFYMRYFAEQGVPHDIPIRVRHVFDIIFDVYFSRIKNTEDIINGMDFLWRADPADFDSLLMEIEDDFGVEIEAQGAEQIRTFQDIVYLVWYSLWKNGKTDPSHPLEPTPDGAAHR